MAKDKTKLEFRYYEMPAGEYVLPKLGRGWEQEYGLGYSNVMHFHNLMEIGCCYHGEGTVEISGKIYQYSGGQFTIIPENMPHTIQSTPGHICKWEFLYIDTERFLKDLMMPKSLSHDEVLSAINAEGFFFSQDEKPELWALIRRMLDECRDRKRYWQEAVNGQTAILMTQILRLRDAHVKLSESQKMPGNYIDNAIRYIYSNYPEDIQITDVAKACGLSESHFRRMFEASMNMKPIDFLNMVRIREACRLIEKGEFSIRDICYQVGYVTPSTFNRNFLKLTGMTPIEWRREKANTAGFFRNLQISAQKGWEAKE